jgi:hypothetical protein
MYARANYEAPAPGGNSASNRPDAGNPMASFASTPALVWLSLRARFRFWRRFRLLRRFRLRLRPLRCGLGLRLRSWSWLWFRLAWIGRLRGWPIRGRTPRAGSTRAGLVRSWRAWLRLRFHRLRGRSIRSWTPRVGSPGAGLVRIWRARLRLRFHGLRRRSICSRTARAGLARTWTTCARRARLRLRFHGLRRRSICSRTARAGLARTWPPRGRLTGLARIRTTWIWPIRIAASGPRARIAIPRSRLRSVSRGTVVRSPGPMAGRTCSGITRRTIIRRTIMPIATIARAAGPVNGPRTIPVIRRTIRISPSAPGAAVVICAMRSPIPTPTAPSPRAVINQQRANPDTNSEGDERDGRHARSRADIDHSGIVLRHINNLRTRRLDYIHSLTWRRLLNLHLHLFIAAQSSRGIGLGAQALNRLAHRSLIRRKRLA